LIWPSGTARNLWDLNPQLGAKVKSYYDDAKVSLWTELKPRIIKTMPNALLARTLSTDRENYVTHPETGEKLSPNPLPRWKS